MAQWVSVPAIEPANLSVAKDSNGGDRNNSKYALK